MTSLDRTPNASQPTASSSLTCHPHHPPMPGDDPGPLLTSHAALVLLAAMFVGAVAGMLTYLSNGNAAGAALAGGGAGAVSAMAFHRLIGS